MQVVGRSTVKLFSIAFVQLTFQVTLVMNNWYLLEKQIFEHDLETWGATLVYDEKKGYMGKDFFKTDSSAIVNIS